MASSSIPSLVRLGIPLLHRLALRDAKKSREEDQQSNCFICNIERYQFDRFADGFDNHIERDHNMWYYVYYLVRLTTKDQSDFTGVESYVYN